MSESNESHHGKWNGRFNVTERDDAIVYTDGSCLGNGTADARAGYGVYFGPGHRNNLSGRVKGPHQANNRAEILAVYHALNKIIYEAGHRSAEVRTDSKFLIDCVTKFMPKWEQNDWKTCTGRKVLNREELELLDEYQTKLDGVRYVHIPRGSDPWNKKADAMAKKGAEGRSRH